MLIINLLSTAIPTNTDIHSPSALNTGDPELPKCAKLSVVNPYPIQLKLPLPTKT